MASLVKNNMERGVFKNKVDHRDWSFHRSYGIKPGSIPFPPNYNTDAGLTMPNQDIANPNYNPPAPALPYGCTSYLVTEMAIDMGNPPAIVSPMVIENVTQANAKHGYDLRQALLAGVKLGLFTGIFNVQAIGQDMFDAVYDAQLSGGTEKRSVAVASKWLPPFETINNTGIIPSLFNINDPNLTYHAWKICGRILIGDQEYIKAKSWQGRGYGDGGFCYFSRAVFNQLMTQSGAVAFTATNGVLPPIQTITTTWLQWLISYAKTLLPY